MGVPWLLALGSWSFVCTLPCVTRLTVTVITHNEGHHVAGALESVAWADEIVVVDSGSSDDTVAIAGRYATRVVQHQWTGYGTQKNYAADLASHDWILSIDADERVAPALADEIRALLRAGAESRRLRNLPRRALSRPVDSQHRLVPGLPRAPLRPPHRTLE